MTDSPETVVWNGVSYTILLTATASGGTIGVFQSEDFPGYGPPRHIHHDADETFVVLAGEVDFLLAGVVSHRGPGSLIFVPRGTEHAFCVRSDTSARMMTVMTPGGFEGFFRAMAHGGYKIPQDMAQIAPIAAAYKLEFTGPPLT